MPLAHATDGGGSIRNPASACGLFGFKAGNGRLVGATAKGATGALSVNGFLTRSVRDAAAIFAATERRDAGAFWPSVGRVAGPSKQRLRIALSTANLYGKAPEPEVARAVRSTAKLCADLGHRVEEAAFPLDGDEFIRQFLVIYGMGAAGAVDAYVERTGRQPDASVMEPFTLSMAAAHRKLPADAPAAALAYLARLEREHDAFLARYDVTLTPVLRLPPPPLGYMDPAGPYDTILAHVIDYASYTPPHNATSVPAMSVPLSWTGGGLPVGSHFAARQGGERTLFEFAYELEVARPWAGRWPPASARKAVPSAVGGRS